METINPNQVMYWDYSWTPINWSFVGTWQEMLAKLNNNSMKYCTIRCREAVDGKRRKIRVLGKPFDEYQQLEMTDIVEFVE